MRDNDAKKNTKIQLIHEINKMGCHVLFLYRIDSLEGDEIKKITPLLMGYIGRFEYFSTNLELILKIGRKGNYQATDFLIEEFEKPNIYEREITEIYFNVEKTQIIPKKVRIIPESGFEII